MDTASVSDKYIDLLKAALCASLYEESAWRVVEGPMRHQIADFSLPRRVLAKLQKEFLVFLRRRNLRLVRAFQYDQAKRDTGGDWPLFGFTMTGQRRLDSLQRCVEEILEKQIPGDLMETGVWRGGSVILMRAILKARNDESRLVWCADSFEGMPVPKETDKRISATADFSDRQYLAVSVEQVQDNFRKFGLLDDRVRFLKGWFSETLPNAPVGQLSLLRLDGDLYESTRDALVNLYHKMSPGGYVIIDDYRSWQGCRTAVDEFRQEHNITAPLEDIDLDAVLWRV